MILIPKKVPVDQRYKEFLKLISALTATSLSDREVDVLDGFFWTSEGIITTDARRKVADSLNVSEHNLNNVLGKLRKKKLLTVPAGKTDEQILEGFLCNLEADKTELIIGFKLIS